MNDLRSFVRYLVPGLTFLVEVAILLTAANTSMVVAWLATLRIAELGAVFGAVLALGGLGYLVGIVHHNLFWSGLGAWYAPADHRGFIQRLQEANHLTLELQTGPRTSKSLVLSRAGAWRVVNAIWHGRRESSQRIKGATARADSLYDLMHGAGSTFVASVLATGVAATLAGTSFPRIAWLPVLLLASALVALHWFSYRTIGAHAQEFIDLVLFEELSSPLQQPAPTSTQVAIVPNVLTYRVSELELQVG